jgi:hypothetical protein
MVDDALIRGVRDAASAVRAEGATALYIYGSRARGDHRPDSDFDVFVDYTEGTGFSLLDLAGICSILSEATGLEVNITTRNSLHPMLRDRIELEAVRVF